jgi:hypothetical protein
MNFDCSHSARSRFVTIAGRLRVLGVLASNNVQNTAVFTWVTHNL